MSDSQWPHGLQPTRLLHPRDFPGKSTGVWCHCLLRRRLLETPNGITYEGILEGIRSHLEAKGKDHTPNICNLLLLFSRQVMSHSAAPRTAACQAPLSSLSRRVCSNSCPLNQWCYLTISSSATTFFSFAFNLSQHQSLFASGGQSIGASASASVLPMNIWGWFPLGLTDLISLQSKGFSINIITIIFKYNNNYCYVPSKTCGS